MASRFVRPETVRLQLADVARRAHEALVTAHHALVAQSAPKATPGDIAQSAQLVARAAQRAQDAQAEGAWLLVKKRLTAGEQRASYARMYLAGVGPNGSRQVDILLTGIALITAYLLDWSLTDDDGQPVAIKGCSIEDLTATLDGLDPESFTEIKAAIEAHEEAMLAERTAEKNAPAGGTNGSATSPLPSEPAGPSEKSEPSTLMTTSSSSS